ncbi:DMT family transporter [Parachitinimonas caeni]|uniref:DMT family transporter n=1 Tax=Parachitinimonas caeni TaxID=3031301 RepID=A0ABT7DZ39_9NEIS|nr:DMT family transporter [Parachitinimonas caeni]MDK2123927.1 DMT family transporter [Parachitinimonas caeni]
MSHARFAFPALLGGGISIGFAGILVHISEVGPVASAFWRLALALPFFLLISLRLPKEAPPWQPHWRLIAAAGVFFALDLGIWHLSLSLTTIANATLLANCVPIFVTLASWLLWREPISRAFLVSLLITVSGAALLAGEHLAFHPARVPGDLLGIVAAVFYCGYLMTIQRARQSLDASRLMLWSGAVSALVLLGFALIRQEVLFPTSLQGWWVLIGLALVPQVLGQTLIAYALAHLPARLSSLGLLIQPVVSAAAAWILFGQALSPQQFIGAAVILLGVWLAKRQAES